MALFISERKKDVTVRRQELQYSPADGRRIGLRRRVFAEFSKGGVPEWAVREAEKRFKMNGKPYELTTAQYLSHYDSIVDQQVRGWTDEERKLIEAKLRADGQVVEIEFPKAKAPWPAYSKLVVHGRRTLDHVVEQIVTKVKEMEFDPDEVIRYERENLNRPEVIDALEKLTEVAVEDDGLIRA